MPLQSPQATFTESWAILTWNLTHQKARMSPKSECFPAFKMGKPTCQRMEDDFLQCRQLQDSVTGSATWHEFSIHDHHSMHNHLERREHSLHFCYSTDDYAKIFQIDLYFEMIMVDISNYKKHSCNAKCNAKTLQSFNGKIERHVPKEKKNCGYISVDHSC